MSKKRKYSYPVPEFIAYLEGMQEATPKDEKNYELLANLLHICHATMENAHAVWQAGAYTDEDPERLACEAIHFGFRRLVPLLLGCMPSGWHEMLAYVEHPETYPWYDPQQDWHRLPPHNEFHPDEDYEKEEVIDAEHGTRVEVVVP